MFILELGKEAALVHINLARLSITLFHAAQLCLINRVAFVLRHNRKMIRPQHG